MQLLGVKTWCFSNCLVGEKLHAPNGYLRIGRLREGMRAWEQVWRLVVGGPHRSASAGSGQHD
jgi:hypothetical protein